MSTPLGARPIGARDSRAQLMTVRRSGELRRIPPDVSRRVLVVGGGLAGVAAAVVLAERGAQVTLREASPQLGGRLSAWADRLRDGTPVQMERGFHAFFRQYYNTRALLRRIDPQLGMLRPVDDYPLYGPNGEHLSFAGLPLRPPWNLAALVRRTPSLGWRELRAMDGEIASEMLAFDGDATYERFDSLSAKEYLDLVGFPTAARRMMFEVFAHSFFNPEGAMSAGEMLMMFHLYFLGTREGLLFDVLDSPFNVAVWDPLLGYLGGLGVAVQLSSKVERIPMPGSGDVDGVVVAVPPRQLRQLAAASHELGDEAWCERVASLQQAPPFAVWRLWLDRPVRPDRAAFAGTGGVGIIDNISVVERYQDEARRWAARTGGSVVELHAYALPDAHGRDETRIRTELLAGLHDVYPETRRASIVDDRFLLRDDCPSFEPGSYARRPTVATPTPGVVLAGDHVRLPFPTALMERAVSSGFVAANALLTGWNITPEPVWSIPQRGLLAGLNRWKRSRRDTAM